MCLWKWGGGRKDVVVEGEEGRGLGRGGEGRGGGDTFVGVL